ncbi:hypothetical protein CUJ89_08560 [Burkholderia pyrrocinia]|uniref:Uncharacterized protein n=1 Tax=Burkholderia pyrrocinia TaxID=60550 RepID=A0A2Z5MUZ3_BURPY|nr:hypothetical protein [Burkholderia pyrrocinia]AXF20526.1 hypothetical protein CUJ89_08560 [Burkholderia pyrrocinia]
MSEITIHTKRTDTTTHRTVLNADEIKRIVTQRVCEAADVEPKQAGVSVGVQLSSRMGNYGSEYEAIVTVTVDHAQQSGAGEA